MSEKLHDQEHFFAKGYTVTLSDHKRPTFGHLVSAASQYSNQHTMIKGILIVNNYGKPRLVKFYQDVVSLLSFSSAITRS